MSLVYLKIIRSLRCILIAISVWIGTLLAGAQLMPGIPVIIGLASAFLISAGGFAINDFFDAESDKLNKPDRPIPAGKVSRRASLVYSALLFIIGVALSYFISFDALAVAAVAAGLLAAYSVQLKNTLLIGSLIISGLLALAFTYGGIIAGNYLAATPLALLIFLSNVGREIYKSIDDALSDRKYKEKSIAIRLGVHNARIIANIFLIVAVIFSFTLYFFSILGATYMFFAVLADIVFLVAAIAPVRYGSKLVKIGMIVAVIAFLAGTYSAQI